MPIPLIFPIAGIIIACGGVTMVVKYAQADQERKNFLDQWLTDALKWAIKRYLMLWYGIDLGSLTPEEEKYYWQKFGDNLRHFLTEADAAALEMYNKPFVELESHQQAEVIRRIASKNGEPTDPINAEPIDPNPA